MQQNEAIAFYKYHGAGNDFIILDRPFLGGVSPHTVSTMCDRRRGIGADGVIFIEEVDPVLGDCRMRIFNPDGREASMCGNGLRCVAKHLQRSLNGEKKTLSIHTMHHRYQVRFNGETIQVVMPTPRLVKENFRIESYPEHQFYWVDSGTDHLVYFSPIETNKEIFDVKARHLRQHSLFKVKGGINVSQVEVVGDELFNAHI